VPPRPLGQLDLDVGWVADRVLSVAYNESRTVKTDMKTVPPGQGNNVTPAGLARNVFRMDSNAAGTVRATGQQRIDPTWP
jgi:hypothetical protein